MAKARLAAGLLTSCLVWYAGLVPASAANNPSAADILRFRPRQEGITISTPTAQEQDSCEVKLVTGAQQGSSGWLLRDAKGKTLRQFFDSNGDKKIDVWSYYLDGVEVYREIDTNSDGKPDQFRWLNSAGTKWGVDVNGDGKIDGWRMISAEEVSQEVLQAVISNDAARLQALFISEAEIKALELPAAEASRIAELQKQAGAKFQSTVRKLALTNKAQWVRLEATVPNCVPANAAGTKQDLIKHPKATILYENGGKHDWILIGEMVQVGLAWRIIDAPTPGDGQEVAGGPAPADPAVQPLLDKLRELDSKNAELKGAETPGANPDVVRYNLQRADVIEQILAKVKPEEREQWIRQLADCLSTAAQSSPESDKTAATRLGRLVEQIVRAMPGSNLAAYVSFRDMSADYAVQLPKAKDFAKVQEGWLTKLAKFVETYPKAEDTPDALLQLGMVSEFVGKEIEAKKWYDSLAKNFADNQLAVKARGALKRLDLEGKPFELAGPMLQGGTFNFSQMTGKVVAVYYWASWNQQCVGDFAKLKLILNSYGSKGLELVCVNLDNTAGDATGFLQRSPSPGVHLFQPGGLESPLATQYGVMVLPNLFLVDKDGKVLSRTVQVSNLEDEVKKVLK
jgi:hypothetical protein